MFPYLSFIPCAIRCESFTCHSNVRELQCNFASQTTIYHAGVSPGIRAGRGLKLERPASAALEMGVSPGIRAGRGLKLGYGVYW